MKRIIAIIFIVLCGYGNVSAQDYDTFLTEMRKLEKEDFNVIARLTMR